MNKIATLMLMLSLPAAAAQAQPPCDAPNPECGPVAVIPADAPRSSLSANAMTPGANSSNATLPEIMRAYVQSVRGNTAPANTGSLNPQN